MNNIQNFAMQVIQSNPDIAENEQYQDMIQAIQNNDAQRGIEIANNILNNMRVTPQQALAIAAKRFGFMR